MTDTQATTDYYKYCPGEDHVKISNAICMGRRRSHYPKCHGCQFNEDEIELVSLGGSGVSSAKSLASTGSVHAGVSPPGPASDMTTLFHPSDIYGTVPFPLSEDFAWRVGHATGQYLRSKLRGYDRADPNSRSILVGRDTREHGQRLQTALIQGIRSTGTDVVDLGLVDTSQLYFAVKQFGTCGGVHVSAGHQPPNVNGFRICSAKAMPIGAETGLLSIRDIAIRVPRHRSGLDSRLITRDLSESYTEFIRHFLIAKNRLPRPIKAVVDASNGVAGRWMPILFKGLRNLRITRLNYAYKGTFNHDPNPLKLKNTRQLRQTIKQQSADFGVCFDSSLERCVFFDEKGHTCRPELLAALLARQFIDREPNATIILDHRSSIAAEEEIARAGGVPIRERTSSAVMKKAMAEHNAIFGSNLSGCFFFRDNSYCESAVLAFVHVVNLLLCTRRKLSELIRPLQRYSSSGEMHFHCEDAEWTLKQLSTAHQDAAIEKLEGLTIRYPDWWFNVRPHMADRLLSVTLEARNRKLVTQRLSELQPLLGDPA